MLGRQSLPRNSDLEVDMLWGKKEVPMIILPGLSSLETIQMSMLRTRRRYKGQSRIPGDMGEGWAQKQLWKIWN